MSYPHHQHPSPDSGRYTRENRRVDDSKKRARRVATLAAILVVLVPLTATGDDQDDYRAYFTGEFGGGMLGAPIYEQTPPELCDDHCGNRTSSMVPAANIDFRLAPVFRSHFGFELAGRANMGYMTADGDIGTTLIEGYAAGRAFLGMRHIRAYGGYEYGSRSLGTSSALGVGTDSFRVHGPLGGVDLCLGGYYNSPRYCRFNLDAGVDYQRPEFDIPIAEGSDLVQGDRHPVFNLRLGFANFFIEGMYAPDYPAANAPGVWHNSDSGQSGVEVGTGRMGGIMIGFSGDMMNGDGGALKYGLQVLQIMADAQGETASSTTPAAGGGTSTTSAMDVEREHTLDICDVWRAAGSGGHEGTRDRWDISDIPAGATFDIRIDAFDIPDRYEVSYTGITRLDTGWRGDASYDGDPNYPGGVQSPGQDEILDMFQKGYSDEFVVEVVGKDPQTRWEYEVRCRY